MARFTSHASRYVSCAPTSYPPWVCCCKACMCDRRQHVTAGGTPKQVSTRVNFIIYVQSGDEVAGDERGACPRASLAGRGR